MVNLGDKVRDQVTGFSGIVIGRTEFLNGCVRCGVQGPVRKDGTVKEAEWMDEPQLEIVKRNAVPGAGARDTGGPVPSVPQRQSCPTR